MDCLNKMASMSQRIALSAILVLFGVTNAAAQDAGRYQAFPLTKPNDLGSSVFIIDTKTGDVWQWFQGRGVPKTTSGSGIRYEGAAVPGTPREMVARQGFGLPVIQHQPTGK